MDMSLRCGQIIILEFKGPLFYGEYKFFCSALGKEWLRITHDSKNPLVIGEGGVDAGETTGQKRNLGICSCVGAMMQYAGPRGRKEPYVALVSNLSLNPDKKSYANLEHLFHSLTQSPFKEIMQDKERTKIEITMIMQQVTYHSNFSMGRLKRWLQSTHI